MIVKSCNLHTLFAQLDDRKKSLKLQKRQLERMQTWAEHHTESGGQLKAEGAEIDPVLTPLPQTHITYFELL
jgi:hypothetical protein